MSQFVTTRDLSAMIRLCRIALLQRTVPMNLPLSIKELTGFALPVRYMELLGDYPTALQKLARADDESETQGYVNTFELLSSLEDVLDINKEVRYASVADPDGNEFHWPSQVLVIGENGEGDYYGIDLSDEIQGVVFFNHQTVEFAEISSTLTEYVELLQESFAA